jgi:ribonucleoside-diphosphate reductase alpha chain
MKRSGKLEPLEIEKIDKMLFFSKLNLPKTFKPDLEKIKSNIMDSLYSGITTEIIQTELINNTLSMVNSSNFREDNNHLYLLMAGRLLLATVYSQVAKNRGYKEFGYKRNFNEMLESGFEKGIYDNSLLNAYSIEELKMADKWIDESADLELTYSAVKKLLKDKYIVYYKDKPFENIQERYMIIAYAAFQNVKDSKKKMAKVKKAYITLSKRKISPATPQFSVILPNSNLASCFTTRCPDSWEGIADLLKKFGDISRAGGAIGIDFSDVRAMLASIQGHKHAAKGVNPFIKLINDVATAIDQLGKRAGAASVALQAYHLDIYDFLSLQDTGGDENQRAREVFPQIIFPNCFYERLYENKEWYIFDPHEIKSKLGISLTETTGAAFTAAYNHIERAILNNEIELYKKTTPLELLTVVMQKFMTKGLPYIANYDVINKMNPNKHIGPINNVNLCVESFSPVQIKEDQSGTEFDHVCNLLSVNHFRCDSDKEIAELHAFCVEILDNILDITEPPTKESETHNNMLRIIGVGVLGEQDYLAKNELTFEKDETLVKMRLLYEDITKRMYEKTIELAKERGYYPAYPGSEFSKGIILGKTLDEKMEHLSTFLESEELDKAIKEWTTIYKNMNKYGTRNGGLAAIAPNTGSATVHDVNGSILPCFKPAFSEKDGKNSIFKISPLAHDPKYMWFYKDAIYVDPFKLIDFVSLVQEYTDQGISFELMHDLTGGEITGQKLYDIVTYAHFMNIKTLYYQRSVFPDGNISEKKECTSCAG